MSLLSHHKTKIVTAEEAVAIIRNGDVLATSGFVGIGAPDELLKSLETRFMKSNEPRDLNLVFAAGQGDAKGKGLDFLAHPGLLKRIVGGHFGLAPKLGRLAMENKFEAYNLPQGFSKVLIAKIEKGCICHLIRSIASRQPGVISKVGIGTFVDPRVEGGKVNTITTENIVDVILLNGEEYLHYNYPQKIDVAFIRGTTADAEGNITMEKEALTLDNLHLAIAAHNSGGYVICQVERLAASGSMHPKSVKIPGIFVDCVVVASPENHLQTYKTPYNPAFSGEIKLDMKLLNLGQHSHAELDERRLISRRAALELQGNSIVNLGIGIPEGVAQVVAEEKVLSFVTLTAEPGIIGGIPASGLDFGASFNPKAIIDQATQFDFYDGGGLDIAFLGMGQCDQSGNVNVSKFAGKLSGCGGFINISQNAKRVVFVGSFTAKGLQVKVENGRLKILREGQEKKFVKTVEQITFAGEVAIANNKQILYVTERCVFRLSNKGLELTEVAPGIDIEKDILKSMEFKPIVPSKIQEMDPSIFENASLFLKKKLLSLPLTKRISYEPSRSILFLNFEGLKVVTQAQVDEILGAVENRIKQYEKQKGLKIVINYDHFYIDEEVLEKWTDKLEFFSKKYPNIQAVLRYTTSAFFRLKLGKELEKRNLPLHVFESEEKAKQFILENHAKL